MSNEGRAITRLHPAISDRGGRRAPVVHVFSEQGYELTVPKTFRDRRLKVGIRIDGEDVEQMRIAARIWEAGANERRLARAEKRALERPTSGEITEISEGRAGRTHVYLDGNFAFSLPSIVAASTLLAVGQELDEDRVRELIAKASVGRVGEMIDRLTAVRPRCAGELRDRLVRERKLDPGMVEAAIEQGLRAGQVSSDVDFIEWFAQARGVRKGKGFGALVGELRRLGVDQEAINEYRDHFDTEGAAEVGIVKAARGLDLDDPKQRQKFVTRVLSRGFRYADARAYLEARAVEIDDELAAADLDR